MITKEVLIDIFSAIFDELPSVDHQDAFSQAVVSATEEISAILIMAEIEKEGDDRVLH